MRYQIQGQGAVELQQRDFLAQGGEAKLYAKNDRVYKLYTDPAHCLPAAKLQELSVLQHPHIIRPQALLLDAQQQPVGYVMPQVSDTVPLAQLFTSAFQRKQGITPAQLSTLADNIRQLIAYAHQQQCLLVDGNEMNYLVSRQDFQRVYCIDVDSWQTPGFPATALLPSIRDHHSAGFSELTDWFAFAVIACQLFVGIHPYKGKHPDFKKYDLLGRMQANVSIFNPRVTLPSAARDFALIPSDFRAWLERVLERGERSQPPALGGGALLPAPRTTTVRGNAQLRIQALLETAAPIEQVFTWNGHRAVLAGDTVYLDKQRYPRRPEQQHLLFSPTRLQPLLAWIEAGELRLELLGPGDIAPLHLKADALLMQRNQLYLLYQDRLTAIRLHDSGRKLLTAPGNSWSVMHKARQPLDGALYQNLLGADYLLLPDGKGCTASPVKELHGYKLLHGKHDGGAVMLTAFRDGRYDRLLLRYDEHYQHYRLRIDEDAGAQEANFCTLDNGLIIHIPHDGELEILPRHGEQRKVVQDSAIHAAMQLAHDGTQVLFHRDNRLYHLTMR